MTAAMIGVGECFTPARPLAGRGRARARRARAGGARRQGRAGAAQRHAVLDRLCAGRPVRGRGAVPARRWSPARCRPTRRGLGRAVRSAHPRAARAIAARSRRPTALRALMAGSAIRASHLVGDERVQDPYCLRCQPQVMGAASTCCARPPTTLETEANGVSDNPLIFAENDEALSGGNFHAEPVAFAADMIALAVCEIGSLAERRIAMLVDPALSGLPAFLTPKPGLNSGLHDPAGDRGGAGVGEQADAPIRRASIRSRPRPTRRTTSRWRRTARAGCSPMAENAIGGHRHRTAGRGAGLRLPRAAGVERGAGGGARAGARRGAASRRRPPFPPRHGGGDRAGRAAAR